MKLILWALGALKSTSEFAKAVFDKIVPSRRERLTKKIRKVRNEMQELSNKSFSPSRQHRYGELAKRLREFERELENLSE